MVNTTTTSSRSTNPPKTREKLFVLQSLPRPRIIKRFVRNLLIRLLSRGARFTSSGATTALRPWPNNQNLNSECITVRVAKIKKTEMLHTQPRSNNRRTGVGVESKTPHSVYDSISQLGGLFPPYILHRHPGMPTSDNKNIRDRACNVLHRCRGHCERRQGKYPATPACSCPAAGCSHSQ